MKEYWSKIILGLVMVSVPFLIAAIRKKIPWLFFWSWTVTSIFSTLVFLLIQDGIEKNMDEKTKMILSVMLGILFVGIGVFMQKIQTENIKKTGWLFVIFGIAWVVISVL